MKQMSELQEIPSRDILDYIKAYSHKFNGCLTGEVFQDAIKEIERLRNILSEMPVIASYSGWVSVNDRLPNPMENLILFVDTHAKQKYQFVSTGMMYPNQTFKWHKNEVIYPNAEVTHWMPLPSKPREDER